MYPCLAIHQTTIHHEKPWENKTILSPYLEAIIFSNSTKGEGYGWENPSEKISGEVHSHYYTMRCNFSLTLQDQGLKMER